MLSGANSVLLFIFTSILVLLHCLRVTFSSKTPGGKLVYLYRKKQGAISKCGDCKVKLHGITPARPKELSRLSRRLKTVTRAYGGSRCHKCVRTRYVSHICRNEVLHELNL